MKTAELQEIWQIEVNGQVYEAAFGELPDWIAEGSLLPEDMVRKGNLRWIKAGRVPHLIQFFNAKAQGIAPPVIVQTTEAETGPLQNNESDSGNPASGNAGFTSVTQHPQTFTNQTINNVNSFTNNNAGPSSGFCFKHNDVPSVYICSGCEKEFCKACPNSYGGSVRICPECGQMCRTSAEINAKQAANAAGAAIMYESFGFSDLTRAIAHPFAYKTSLISGAVIFIFLGLGQAAIGLGGIIFPAVGFICLILSNGLTFSILANTVDKFAHGKVDADFMPDFENFSVWDDFIHPSLLGISAYLVAFGPFLASFALAAYMVFSSVSAQMTTYQTKLESVPGTPVYNQREVADQTAEVRKLLTETAEKNDAKLTLQDQTANPAPKLDEETIAQNKLWEEVQADRKRQLESMAGGGNELSEQQMMLIAQNIINVAAPVMVVGFLLLIWGMIFFPAVCAVAGYTRSIAATLNPLVSLSTMFNVGGNYVKLLFLTVLLSICSVIMMLIAVILTAPLSLIALGNLPGKAAGAAIGFYFWVVFSCLIGYMIFKSADKLDIKR